MHSAKLQTFAFFELRKVSTAACNSLHSTRKPNGRLLPEFTNASARVYVSAGVMNFSISRHSRGKNLRPVTFALLFVSLFFVGAYGQINCGDSDNPLDTAPPKGMSMQELTQKLIANEDKVQAARQHYTFTQDVLVQTLEGKAVDGQFHQITNVYYDDKGKRAEKVSFAEQSTLRGIQLSDADMDDIRTFMPWILTSDQAAQYNLTYAGKQHVDDLDTYVFHVEPKQFEKNRRYFQGKIWVDDRDVQMVKLCGKSVPEATTKKKKKNDTVEVRPTFVGYRQIIDGNWFPTYARIDDTLRFDVQSIHVREIVKFIGYQRAAATQTASRP
jgi:hypothetical protein